MNRLSETTCAHGAILFAGLLGAGLLGIMGWIPPIDPLRDSQSIFELYTEDRLKIRFGAALLVFGSMFWWMFSAVVSTQMKSIEGESHPWADVQLISGFAASFVVLLPAFFWLIAAFRTDLPPQTVQLFNDAGWIILVGAYPPAFLQALSIGLCILFNSRTSPPIYRQWVGYFNLWVALVFLPGAFVPFFKTGPFAWNGIIGFWLVIVVTFLWIITLWLQTLRAINIRSNAHDDG